MRAAGLLDTALINPYNSFWLALLAKRSFFLTVKERYLRKPTFNSLCDPFGSPYRGQKPFSERKDVTALLDTVYAPSVPPLREGPYPIPKP